MRPTYVFDIETAALPLSELESIIPEFNPADVKVGNLGPDKAAQKIAEAEKNHKANFIEKAALSPITGRVLAIGMLERETGVFNILHNDADEQALINAFWNQVKDVDMRQVPLIGFNTHLFDLPFLIKRGWKHGIPAPVAIRKGRYFADHIVDLRNVWQMGDRQAEGSLDAIAQHFGIGKKTGNGKDFAATWATNRPAAEAYLENDIRLTAKMADVMGVVV